MKMSKQLAALIILSAQAHVSSYDAEAAAAANLKESERRQEAESLKKVFYPFVDYSKFYKLSVKAACERICGAELYEPVYLLLETAWNDSLGWAGDLFSYNTEVALNEVALAHLREIAKGVE